MRKVQAVIRHSLALLVTLLFVLPLYWAFVNSLRTIGAPPPNTLEWWPATPQWNNYVTLFELLPVPRYSLNSFLVVALAVPLTLITASLAGFGIARMPHRARRRLLIFSVVVLMIPDASVWLLRFQILRWFGLLDSLWALIAPAFAATSPLFVLLYYWNFRRVPAGMFEAARLDGAGIFVTWRRLALPLARPTTIAVAVLSFVLYWSDFISPVLYIFDPAWYTMPVGLQILKQLDATNWPLLMAGAVVMTMPVLILFVMLQRFFLSDGSLATLFERN